MRTTGLTTRLASPLLIRRLPPAASDAVLLTFDDGPAPGVTDGVLERLARHGARSVFCVVGELVETAPELVRACRAAGHGLGNHSHVHDMSRLPSPSAYLRDLDRCSAAIRAAAGCTPRWFRAPGGRLHPASLLGPHRRGMRHLHWSVDPLDWCCRTPQQARATARRLAAEIRGRDIVLLHEYDALILDLLDELLPALVARGFDLAGGLAALERRDGSDAGCAA
ncbi:MAG: polysaccharide deacetylase family protein [bacterium]|nr:polysaccharide deacetylase family protein [bacterium]